jgi:hypothetical protein
VSEEKVKVINRDPSKVLQTGLYPSVTRVLDLVPKPFLVAWACKIGREGAPLLDGTVVHDQRRITDQSRRVGELAHRAIARVLLQDQGKEPGVDDDQASELHAAENAALVWEQVWWANHQQDRILAVEQQLESDKHGFLGRADLVTRDANGLQIWDWKTGNSIYPETRMELAAYACLVSEAYDEPVTKVTAVRLDTSDAHVFNPVRDVMEIDDYGPDLQLFLELVPVFRDLQAWMAEHHG